MIFMLLAPQDAAVWRSHGEEEARSILEQALKQFGLSRESLGGLKKSDERKLAIARVIRQRTSVANSWLARELALGHVSAVSRCMNRNGKSSP